MEFHGVVPIDAPDPSVESEARLRAVSFPVVQLTPRPSLTRSPITGFAESLGPAGREDSTVAFTYTLWRHPEDHADPRNEIELDERTRRAIEEEPPWGRPTWLIAQARLLKYPMLWEAVRTTWSAASGTRRTSLPQSLMDHTDHVLRNQFREELGLPPGPTSDTRWQVTPAAVSDATANLDGRDVPALQIDTDPFVYSLGFRLDEHVVCTSVLPRDSLPVVDLTFTTDR